MEMKSHITKLTPGSLEEEDQTSSCLLSKASEFAESCGVLGKAACPTKTALSP